MMTMPAATLLAICLSATKGHRKHPCACGRLRTAHGLEGDAHAGPWHRQLSLLALSDIESMRARGLPDLAFGSFAENLVIDGLDFEKLGPGSRLRLGAGAEIRITQIGKECHTACAIRTQAGDCIMPTRGLFAEVLHGGDLIPGDVVVVLDAVPRPLATTTRERP